MADWPTTEDVRAFLRLPSPMTADDEAVLSKAVDAANDYGNRRTNYKFDPAAVDPPAPDPPAIVAYAATQHAARLFRRRDSTDGTIGFGDAGIVRIGRSDPDIEALYDSIGPMVVG